MLKISAHFAQIWHHTTVLALKSLQQTIIIADGQVTQGSIRVKNNANKLRELPNSVYCGFSGSVADCFTLLQQLQQQLNKYPAQVLKSCIQLGKKWRINKLYRHLSAKMLVIDKNLIIELTGEGDVLEIEKVRGIGSGGLFAQCAAQALLQNSQMGGQQIVMKSMQIASRKCIYTNTNYIMKKIVN